MSRGSCGRIDSGDSTTFSLVNVSDYGAAAKLVHGTWYESNTAKILSVSAKKEYLFKGSGEIWPELDLAHLNAQHLSSVSELEPQHTSFSSPAMRWWA